MPDDACAETQPAPTALLDVVTTPLVWLNASGGAPAARVLRAIRDGRVARWLRPLWNPRTFGARVEIAQAWVDQDGVAALLPCGWATHAIQGALQPEACRLMDEALAMDVDWWRALETKAAAAALSLQGSHATATMGGTDQDLRTVGLAAPSSSSASVPTNHQVTCEPWCAAEPCSALTGDALSILQECGGCDAMHGAGCWPGAADFPKF